MLSKSSDKVHEIRTSSMIVPVWLYHERDPQQQVMVYALLDPTSNGTFVKNDAMKKLGIDGTEVNLNLITMHGTEMILTQKITGLVIENLERNTQIRLPNAVYCRNDIPSRRDEIPRPGVATSC